MMTRGCALIIPSSIVLNTLWFPGLSKPPSHLQGGHGYDDVSVLLSLAIRRCLLRHAGPGIGTPGQRNGPASRPKVSRKMLSCGGGGDAGLNMTKVDSLWAKSMAGLAELINNWPHLGDSGRRVGRCWPVLRPNRPSLVEDGQMLATVGKRRSTRANRIWDETRSPKWCLSTCGAMSG